MNPGTRAAGAPLRACCSRWRWRSWAAGLLVGLLLAGCWPTPLPASDDGPKSVTVSPSTLEEVTRLALSLLNDSRLLVTRLTERTGQVETLKAEVESWTRRYAELLKKVESLAPLSGEVARLSGLLRTALLEISNLHNASETALKDYTRSLQAERAEATRQIAAREREVRAWRGATVGAAVAALLALLLALLT